MNIAIENLDLLPEVLDRLKNIEKRLENSYGKRWLSVEEAAKYLSYSKDRIYKIKAEELVEGKHYFKKGKILFDKFALDEWVLSGYKNEQINVKQKVDEIIESVLKDIQR